MEDFLRNWRQDALNKAQYEAAIFVGDKLLAQTNDDKDVFWLAQVHFAQANYTRAQALLSNADLIARSPSCRYLAAHCLIKQARYEDALEILGDRNPTHLIPTAANKRKVQSSSSSKNGPGDRARGTIGSAATAAAAKREQERQNEAEDDRRHEAGMCYLRGLCWAKQNAFDRAKECYKDACRIDVLCFEAFQQLTKNLLMSPDEEWEFLNSLDFGSLVCEEGLTDDGEAYGGDFVHMLYSTQLSKYKNQSVFQTAFESLSTHYNLATNPDLLLARADLLYTQCRYKDALEITSEILEDDKYNFAVFPLHLACLFELGRKNILFLLAHDLADHHPDEPVTWLAVGIYYLATNRIPEARRYFSKASMMDAHFGPAWIGFAHTFAAEGEHDQAISAYSTAARLFMGTHLPQVFLGMQNHAMNNMTVADEFLKTAFGLCPEDPLLLNEMGVVRYHQDRLDDAAQLFREALRVADRTDSEPHAWLSARTNLAHAYRKMRQFPEALHEFNEVLRRGGKDAAIFCAKGLVFLDMGLAHQAVAVLHEALAMSPQDPVATELLNKALEEMAVAGTISGVPVMMGPEEFDEIGAEEMERQCADFETELRLRVGSAGRRVEMMSRSRDKGKGKAVRGKGKGKARVGAVYNYEEVYDDLEKSGVGMEMSDEET